MRPKSNWRLFAACLDLDNQIFFPTGDREVTDEAAEVCRTCRVQTDCLEVALQTPELNDFGTWGGTSPEDRRRIRRRRQRSKLKPA